MIALEIAFWASVGLLVYTHLGYPLVLWLLVRLRRRPPARCRRGGSPRRPCR